MLRAGYLLMGYAPLIGHATLYDMCKVREGCVKIYMAAKSAKTTPAGFEPALPEGNRYLGLFESVALTTRP